ncbi:hypothetical protein Bhyg_01751 [Pseudolycoriella hygida]|uniref:Uncharacterized protein n=1 Tax=Pseudolycoriella hygida TaxID=35572 RepID=A0A9Q0S755_9DIPT|nr:hypothetical protein Bhyg_01751 [Pseudolycoriella hygida]
MSTVETRSGNKRRKKFVKRAYNQSIATIRILWPLVKKLRGGTNDFLHIVLKTLTANRSLSSVYRIKQLVRGFSLQKKPTSWNALSLTLNPETNWFASCRSSDLEIIGPIMGYFLRTKAEHFCDVLSPSWSSTDNFDGMDNILNICDEAIAPFVIELAVSERSAKQLEKFVHISSGVLSTVKIDWSEGKQFSKTIKIHEIRHDYHKWAWTCLKKGEVGPICDNELTTFSSCRADMMQPLLLNPFRPKECLVKKTQSGRVVKARKFFQ